MDAPSAPANDVESSSSSSSAPAATGAQPPHFLKVKWALFFTNVGMMIFLAATGALGMGSAETINDTGLIFVGLYLIIFSGLVFFYELSQVLKWERMDDFMKQNFGFLYGVNGKSLFILMYAKRTECFIPSFH
jgi:cytochrome c biogenesis protein CcdA